MKALLGIALINYYLPHECKIVGALNKGSLDTALIKFARTDPKGYAKNVSKIKEIGDDFATYEGTTVGLSDIRPQHELRDPIIDAAYAKWKGAKTDRERIDIQIAAQNDMQKVAIQHPGDLGLQARSGGRGNVVQLAKTLSSQVACNDQAGNPDPLFIRHSYAEGLSPMEHYVTGLESRGDVVKGKLGVAEPGDLGKTINNIMNRQVIRDHDCGTTNGISLPVEHLSLIDRFTAKEYPGVAKGTLITPDIISALKGSGVKNVMTRSPTTCEHTQGLCQLCQGLDVNGNIHPVGTNIGMRGAHSLAEPLTQLSLSYKHAISSVKEKPDLSGLKGIQQIMNIPKEFNRKATIAQVKGQIDDIEDAPQGGYFVHQGGTKHYILPDRKILVRKGDTVKAGDRLSSGVVDPREVVTLKGMGEGRRYVINTLNDVYKEAGINVDRRHLENFVKQNMQYYTVEDPEAKSWGFQRGDIIDHNQLKDSLTHDTYEAPAHKSLGKILGKDTLHHMAGTPIDDDMLQSFHESGITNLHVADTAVKVTPHLTPIVGTPLLNPDWTARLGHKYIKSSIIDAATEGHQSRSDRYDPIPAFVHGEELDTGHGEGKY